MHERFTCMITQWMLHLEPASVGVMYIAVRSLYHADVMPIFKGFFVCLFSNCNTTSD